MGLDPLTEAVTLSCGHKMNRPAAIQCYGPVEKGICALQGRCVICRSLVTTYFPDRVVSELATQFFSLQEDLEGLPTRPLVLESKGQADLPYPGTRGVFTPTVTSWDTARGDKELAFTSSNGSLLKTFTLIGFGDGTIRLSIGFKKDRQFLDYLMVHRLPVDEVYDWCFATSVVDQIRVLFRIIVQNNTVDQPSLPQLEAIVERGRCDLGVFSPPQVEFAKVAPFDQERVLALLNCPKEKTLLTDAVNLFPCCHKVSEVAAQGLQACTVCHVLISGSVPDYTVRDVASRFKGLNPVQPPNLDLTAAFVLVTDNWDLPYKNYSTSRPLARKLEFLSVTKGSLLNRFELLGYWQGEVRFYFHCHSENEELFNQLLKSHGITRGSLDIVGYRSKNHGEMKTLFRIVALNNEIPADYFYKIRSIVEKGMCEALPKVIGSPYQSHFDFFD